MDSKQTLINKYIEDLKAELAGVDMAIVVDAVSDANEYFYNELREIGKSNPELSDRDVFNKAQSNFGTPKEFAQYYLDTEETVTKALHSRLRKVEYRGGFLRIFSDPQAYTSFFFTILYFITGVFYFAWALTGMAVSISFGILIFGIPVALFFFGSYRVFSHVESRLVEAVLKERMPRRRIFERFEGNITSIFMQYLKDGYTWRCWGYMMLRFPLGLFSFLAVIIPLGLAVDLILTPILNREEQVINGILQLLPVESGIWILPITIPFSFLFVVATLYISKMIGRLQARFAKAMLVSGREL